MELKIIMPYKSFTQKNKFLNIELEQDKQKVEIPIQYKNQTKIVKRVNSSQPLTQNISLLSQWDSDWEDMEYIYVASVQQYQHIWKNWSVSFGRMSLNSIDNIYVEILLRNPIGITDFSISNKFSFKKFIGWNIVDIEGQESSNTKIITLHASIYSNYLPQPLFQTKLLVKYFNPISRD